MSTTFGIPRLRLADEIVLEDDCLPPDFIESDFVIIAFRSNHGRFSWLTEVYSGLPDETKIYPLDNSAQGIYTIGDVRAKMDGEQD